LGLRGKVQPISSGTSKGKATLEESGIVTTTKEREEGGNNTQGNKTRGPLNGKKI